MDPVAVAAADEEKGRCKGLSPERRKKGGHSSDSPSRRTKDGGSKAGAMVDH